MQTISVVMPNYNDADHISISLRAICEQDYPPLEVIVIDDGSTDNSVEIVQKLAQQYSGIKLLRNDSNQGVIYSANRGAELTKGSHLYFASANDLVLPGFFKKSMMLLDQYPGAGLCCTDSREICSLSGATADHRHGWLLAAGYLSPEELANITHDNHPLCLGGTNSILRRDVLGQRVLLSELRSFCDWFLCLVAVLRYGCCYVPEVLTVVNSARDSYSGQVQRDRKLYKNSCIQLFQLLGSREYEDILPFVIQSRSLDTIEMSCKNPLTVFKALWAVKTSNQHVRDLFCYMTSCYFLSLILPIQRSLVITWQIVQKAVQRTFQRLRDSVVTVLCFVQNLYDQAYAHCFHEFDKARTIVRRKLDLPK